jgi:hypothetical protein
MVGRAVLLVMTIRSRDGEEAPKRLAAGDGKVMTRTPPRVRLHDMAKADPIDVLVLEEFRLRVEDVDGAVARIVAASPHGIELAIPLLTSIDDRRDVATLRALHAREPTVTDAAQRAALDPFVASWAAPKHYGPRITEHSQRPPSSFRLAVTESGINAGGVAPLTLSQESTGNGTTSHAVALLWIGAPIGTYAGLLILLGSCDETQAVEHDRLNWPLPLSRDLGVRIYENSGPNM